MSGPDNLAADLARARREGGLLAIPVDGPQTLDQAYAAAGRLCGKLGGQVGGWKIGASSEAGQRFFDLIEPFWGAVLAGEIQASPGVLPGAAAPFLAEAEVVLRLGRDVEAADLDRPAAEWVDGAWLGLEIVRPSYRAPLEVGVLAVIADKGANWGLVIGQPIADWATRDLGALTLRLNVGDEVSPLTSAREAGFSPMAALAWLAHDKVRRGSPLRAGQLVATGAIGPARPMQGGQQARLWFDGEVAAQVSVAARDGGSSVDASP